MANNTVNHTTLKILLTGGTFGGVWASLGHGGLGGVVAAGVAYVVLEHSDSIINKVAGKFSPQPQVDEAEVTAEELAEYRRIHGMPQQLGTGVRSQDASGNERAAKQHAFDSDFDAFSTSSTFMFSQLLATGWRPSFHEIFLARLPDGTNVFVTVEQLVHIALSGATRNGKTSLIRQILSELIYVGCDCILLDPHFTPYDVAIQEDWTPFIPRLRFDPTECKDFRRIEQILEYTANTILAKRKMLRGQSRHVGKPIFLMIDEYPAIMAKCPNVEKYIGTLLREGAKYQIFLCIASHDFLVKTAFPSMGSGLRDCLKTVLHLGGNIQTARELLDLEKIDKSEEASLGKGRVYLRCETHKEATLAQTPWMDDEAIHELVGPSTYVPGINTEELDDEWEESYDMTADINVKSRNVSETSSNVSTQSAEAPTPILPQKERKAEDIDISYAVKVWNALMPSVKDMEQIFGLKNNQARVLREKILKMAEARQPDSQASE